MNNKSDGKSQFVEAESRHQCLIYDGPPSQQLPALAAMTQRKLDEGYRFLYLNSRPMVAGMRSSLAAIGVDVVNEVDKARLILSSEPTTSADGGFDVDSMLHKLEGAVGQALNDGYHGLWATGDMTWEFGCEKNFAKLLEYEYGLDRLFRKRQALCGICQYHRDMLPREAPLTHGMIFINETLSRVNPHYVPSGLSNNHASTAPEWDETMTALCQLKNTDTKS